MNLYKCLVLVTLLLTLSTITYGYKILGIFAYCAHSHHQTGFVLLKELADRGHNVTMITCFPPKEKIENLRVLSVAEILPSIHEMNEGFLNWEALSHWGIMQLSVNVGITFVRNVFQTETVQHLVKSEEEFDLVILENMVNDGMTVFHHRFNCPLVLVSPARPSYFNNHFVSNPILPAYMSNFMSDYGSEMNFWQRLDNTYRQIASDLSVYFYHIPGQAKIVKEFFPDAPDLETFVYNASFLFTNSHGALSDPLPLQQNVREIGGFHVLPNKPLPKDIKEFLDSAKDGAILFSMGSLVRSDDFDPNLRKAILNVFAGLKQKIIWKFGVDLPEKSDNVMISNWLPQQDILAHPNVIGFISHGGILGTFEAIHFGVPILGLPVFWDQPKNVADIERRGIGLRLNLKDLNENSFRKALNELIHDPKYRKRAKEISQVLRDQPTKQLDEAIFWIERVIKHKGLHHLKSAALRLKWYQLYLLDIVAFLTITVILIAVVIKVVFCTFLTKKIKKD